MCCYYHIFSIDLSTALKNVIEGHLDVHNFEKFLTQNLNLQLTPIQQKVISRMKYDQSVEYVIITYKNRAFFSN